MQNTENNDDTRVFETKKQARLDMLKRSSLPLAEIYETNQKLFQELLKNVETPKLLILDKSLAGPIGLFVEPSELREWGIKAWYVLGDYDIDLPRDLYDNDHLNSRLTIIFLCRPSAPLVPLITHQISYFSKKYPPSQIKFIISWIPRCTVEITHLLKLQIKQDVFEQMQAQNVLEFRDCPVYFFPYDVDLICLELPSLFRLFHAHGDAMPLVFCSEAILELQVLLNGLIHRVCSVGNASKFISDQLLEYRRNLQSQYSFRSSLDQNIKSLFTPKINTKDENRAVPPLHLFLSSSVCVNPKESSKSSSSSSSISSVGSECEEGMPPNSFSESTTVIQPWHQFNNSVDDLLLIDRRSDLITLFVTPFTYEALLDLCIGIKHTQLQVPLKKQPDESSPSEQTRATLNATDSVFSEIRNLPQGRVGSVLHEKATYIQQTYKEKEKLQSISEINNFMKRFKVKQQEHAFVALHVNLLTFLSDILKSEDFQRILMFEDEIMNITGTNKPSNSILQRFFSKLDELIEELPESPVEIYHLLCLFSVLANGVPAKFMAQLRTGICQHFGIEELHRLHLLETCGLLITSRDQSSKSNWPETKLTLDLLQKETDSSTVVAAGATATSGNDATEDMSYVCAGYAPLSGRLVEYLYKKHDGWKSFSKLFDIIWGPTLEITQRSLNPNGEKPSSSSFVPTTIVFYVGGCTYAEIAAIRHLEKSQNGKRKFVILTTEILNYKKLLDQFSARNI